MTLCFLLAKAREIQEGLHSLRKMVSDLENKQKTVLGVALPVESECVCLDRSADPESDNGLALNCCFLLRYEEGAADSSRGDQNVGGSNPEETEE